MRLFSENPTAWHFLYLEASIGQLRDKAARFETHDDDDDDDQQGQDTSLILRKPTSSICR